MPTTRIIPVTPEKPKVNTEKLKQSQEAKKKIIKEQQIVKK